MAERGDLPAERPVRRAQQRAKAARDRRGGRSREDSGLPDPLLDAFLRLRQVESTAHGAALRDAWRDTGQLVSAALELGYGAQAVANALGTSPSSVRSRARAGDWITVGQASRLLGVDVVTLRRLATEGLLPAGRLGADGGTEYHRRDVLVVLIAGMPLQN